MKKIAMYGPGHGHNIEKWLSFFNHRSDVELTFIYYGDGTSFEQKYRHVNFIKIRSTISLCWSLRQQVFDLFIVHGAYSPYQSMLLSLLIRKRKMLLVAWGNGILNCFKGNNFKKKLLTTTIFKLADRIAAPDQLMRDIISFHPNAEHKKYNFLWGIAKEYHGDNKEPLHQFTSDFLKTIKNKYFVFWPRSILRLSRYDIAIEALAEIKVKRPDIIKQMKLIIWTGNTIDNDYLKELEDQIEQFDLSDNVSIIVHPFLPDTDVKEIWQQANLSINLIENDGFSTQLGEAFITETPLIVNEIEAYSLVKKRYDLPLQFTPLNATDVACAIERKFDNAEAESNDLISLKRFTQTTLNNDINFDSLLRECLDS